MGLMQHLYCLLWLFGLFCLIQNSDAQSQNKRSSRITSSRTSFGTNVKSSSSSSSSSSSNGVNFDCPEEFGYYPHPTDCTQYYVCVFGGALLESCTGGLMYSHELQTCDWPRNVGCEVVDTGDVLNSKQQQQQQQNHVPSRVRFGSAFTSPQAQTQQPQQVLKPTVPPQYHRQPPQVIQAQVQTIPPPPALKVPPNPVVTSRGQPKHLLEAQEEIAKLYADAHESLPVEEEESDRQQRVYRGQPSTVSQVQKDRDGIIHQASINAIPNNDKYSSYSFGTQYRMNLEDLDLLNNGLDATHVLDPDNLEFNAHKRYKRDLVHNVDIPIDQTTLKTTSESITVVSNKEELDETKETETPKITKYSSKFSANSKETLNEIEELLEELYGPEFKTKSTDELMDLMKTKVNIEIDNSRKLLNILPAIMENSLKAEKTEIVENLEIPTELTEDSKVTDLSKYQQFKENLQGIPQISQEEIRTQLPLADKLEATTIDRSARNLEVTSDTSNEGTLSKSTTIDRLGRNLEVTSDKSNEATSSKKLLEEITVTELPMLNEENVRTEIITHTPESEDMEYLDTDDNAVAETVVRTIRQLRPYNNNSPRPRAQWQSGNNYRSIDSSPYQQQQQHSNHHQTQQSISYAFGPFNPYLSPPATPAYSPLNSVNSPYKPNFQNIETSQSHKQKPKVVYTGYNLSLPPPKSAQVEDDFRPMVGNYYNSGTIANPSTTLRPLHYLAKTDLLPYILQSLKELKEQRKKLQGQNYSYFHLGDTTVSPLKDYKTTTPKVTPNSHYSQISTVGGFYNNKHFGEQKPSYYNQFSNAYETQTGFVPSTTTESNYFKYNVIANQKMKNYFSTLKPATKYEETSLAPVTSNINIINPPKLSSFPGFDKFVTGITYSNTSSTVPESYQTFIKAASSTQAPIVRPQVLETSSKAPIKLQFNLPEFLSNLQSKDMAHLNPTVVDMLKYFKEVNKPLTTNSKSTGQTSTPTLNLNEISITQSSSSARPVKGYESYLNSLKTSTLKPSSIGAPEYYDEEYEAEEEEEADEDIQPPSEMPPYMPMTETMAPPRQQMMPPPKPTDSPLKSNVNYATGYMHATTTRRPFFSSNFDQFNQQPQQQNLPNQIPSFIKFPSDYFQEIKQKLPSITDNNRPSSGLISNPYLSTTIRLTTTTSTSTTTAPTSSTIGSTATTTITTTQRPTTTTVTIPKMRYTIRPNRNRGQDKRNNSTNSIYDLNGQNNATTTLTLDLKPKILGIRKRPITLASSSTGLNTGTGSNLINLNLKDMNGPNRIESSSPASSQSIHSQTATPANIFLQNIRPTPQQQQQQQQHQVIVETIPSSQTQNHYRNQQQQQQLQQQHQNQQQQLSPPLPTLAQPQPFSQNRNYYNTTTSASNNNYNNNNNNNNHNNHNVDVVSYVPQEQHQQQPQQHSSQQQQQQQQSLIPQSDIQQSEQSPYDTYYSVYDDDIDLYRDIEYQQQHQQPQQHQQHQQQQQHYQQPIRTQHQQQSTYRPVDIFTTATPQSVQRETYKQQSKPERPTYTNQQPLVYNSDYDEDLIAQIEQDNAYDQPTRPPTRNEQIAIKTLNNGPSSTVRPLLVNDQRNYYSTLTTPLPPMSAPGNDDEYIYETEYLEAPDYYYNDKLRPPVVPTTYTPIVKLKNEDYNTIIAKLPQSNGQNEMNQNRHHVRPEVTMPTTRTTAPSTTVRSTITTTTTPKTTTPTTTVRTTKASTTTTTTRAPTTTYATTTTTTAKPSTTKLTKTPSPLTTTTSTTTSTSTKSRSSSSHFSPFDSNADYLEPSSNPYHSSRTRQQQQVIEDAEEEQEQIVFNIGKLKTSKENRNYNRANNNFNKNNNNNNIKQYAQQNVQVIEQQQQSHLIQNPQQQDKQKQQLQLLFNPSLLSSSPPQQEQQQVQHLLDKQYEQVTLVPFKANKTESYLLTLLTDNVDFSNRSKQTHANKKLQLQQQQEQLQEPQLQQQQTSQISQQKQHIRQEPKHSKPKLSQTTSSSSTSTTTTTSTTSTTQNPQKIPSTKTPFPQAQESYESVAFNSENQHSKALQNLEDVETVYDESQNVHVQSAEPPKTYAAERNAYNAANYATNSRANLARTQTDDRSSNEFKAKSYEVYAGAAGLKSNEFQDASSKHAPNKKHIKTFVISDLSPQSFRAKPTEKQSQQPFYNNNNNNNDADDVEVLNGASSSTTLRYPTSTHSNNPESKPFEYKLQTGSNGFTLRAQHLNFPTEENKPLFERKPVTQYFTTPSVGNAKTAFAATTTTTVLPTTKTTSTTSTTTATTTSTTAKAFKPPTQVVYLLPNFGEVIEPTTYAPPLRTWRNGRPTIQSSTTASPSPRQFFNDYVYKSVTESSKLQDLAKEYLPKSSSTTTTTTTTTTSRPTTTTTSTTRPPPPTTPATSERVIQSYTARASTFKDSLQKTTLSTNARFVSPYKSLETILQKEEKSAYANTRPTSKTKYLPTSSTAHPFLQTTAKPLRSYFLITSPPKNLNETLFATMSTNSRNFSISDAIIGGLPGQSFKPVQSKPTTTTTTTVLPTTTTTTTTESTTPTTMSTIIATSALRLNADKPRPRGRSRYTAATVTNLLDSDDAPTTYSPKYRYRPNEVEVTTSPSSSYVVRRKVQRARIAALQTQRQQQGVAGKPRDKYQYYKDNDQKSFESEQQSPKAEALVAGPLDNNQDNSIENTKSSETTEEIIVAITDRPLKYYYSNKYRQQTGERTLADSLQNAGYITSNSAINKSNKNTSVLEQLKLFLTGGDSQEDSESSSPQFVNENFHEPEIKAAVQEIKNLYANGGTRPTWTSTTTTTLRPTTTARPSTVAYTSSTAIRMNSSTASYSTLQSTLNVTQNTKSFTPSTAPNMNTPTVTTSTTTTTPKYYPKFPSSTFSFLSSSTTTTTTTTTTPAIKSNTHPNNYNQQSSSTQSAYAAAHHGKVNGVAASPAGGSSSGSHYTSVSSSSSSSSATAVQSPARASRVNSALKSSIAAAATALPSSLNANNAIASSGQRNANSNKFSVGSSVKCSDTTSNAKCNEIPSRINSNSNRNRGSVTGTYNQGDIGSVALANNRGTHPPRTRPTLKPSGTIVSKAQEFIDIYRYPPTRPDPLYPQPTPDKTAAKCRKDVCLLPDCYCGGRDIPGNLKVNEVPQIVLMTFDDAVSTLNIELYGELFNNATRRNPNGCPIRGTFYVSHEWTDYGMVQDLYADGHELASHTVSHSFGEQFSQKKWTREVAGQREILSAYGGVKVSDVRGMRAPFLSVGGNKMYKMLYDSNFTYDSSMPVYENRPPSWPYTLDYKIFHDCMIPPCPTKSYPGVWQVPMVMWQDLNGGRCSMGDACANPSDSENVSKMIMKNFERHYTTNRAPFGLFYHAAWFTQPHHKEGFIKFLDAINAMPDVWIVTNWQALQWVRDPTPISRINSFQPFQCDYSDRPKRCNNPKVCNLWHKSGVRYMKTCQPCPDIYPWTGKTGIRSSRIDNEIEEPTT